jgi:cystathionine beta-lyase
MAPKRPKPARLKPATRLVAAGRDYCDHGMVNPAVYHASTILYPDIETLRSRSQPYVYGRRGTPTSRAVEDAIADLEGGYGCKVTPSGLAAVSATLLAFLSSGDHLLVTDNVYEPTRLLCNGLLRRMGVETTYYDPLSGGAVAELIRPNTKLILTESPGSQSFEVQDIPAIVEAAHAHEVLVAIDNTWSAGHFFKAFEHGCDISIQAATKYLVGHSDCMMGSITVNEANWDRFYTRFGEMGLCAGPDDLYLTLRGIRTLDVRLERHMRSGLEMAAWLKDREEVAEVRHPGLPGALGHDLWKRDFTGASGLFSVILKSEPGQPIDAFFNALELFGMGFSWGGYESLAIPCDLSSKRTATSWNAEGQLIRFHIGLEDVEDLKADLDRAFKALADAS